MQYDQIGRVLITLGAVVVVACILFLVLGKAPFGRLPGDIAITNGNFTCVAPIVTMLLVSLVVTIVVNIILALFRR